MKNKTIKKNSKKIKKFSHKKYNRRIKRSKYVNKSKQKGGFNIVDFEIEGNKLLIKKTIYFGHEGHFTIGDAYFSKHIELDPATEGRYRMGTSFDVELATLNEALNAKFEIHLVELARNNHEVQEALKIINTPGVDEKTKWKNRNVISQYLLPIFHVPNDVNVLRLVFTLPKSEVGFNQQPFNPVFLQQILKYIKLNREIMYDMLLIYRILLHLQAVMVFFRDYTKGKSYGGGLSSMVDEIEKKLRGWWASPQRLWAKLNNIAAEKFVDDNIRYIKEKLLEFIPSLTPKYNLDPRIFEIPFRTYLKDHSAPSNIDVPSMPPSGAAAVTSATYRYSGGKRKNNKSKRRKTKRKTKTKNNRKILL